MSRNDAWLRELQRTVVPVDAPEVAAARRARTIHRLSALQHEGLTRGRRRDRFYRVALVVGLAALPPAVAAASWAAWQQLTTDEAQVRASLIATKSGGERATGPAALVVAVVPSEPPAPAVTAEARAPMTAPEGLVAPSPPSRARPSRTLSRARALASAPRSTLAEENALMERALAAGRCGEDQASVALLGELLRRFPGSPLAQNAQVERFRALRRQGDVTTAVREARRYLGEHPDGMALDEAHRLAVESARTGPER